MDVSHDSRWMREALREAEEAFNRGEVPIGAVIVKGAEIVGRGHNLVETLGDATAHAEIVAIGAAARTIGTWRLNNATLYTTVEPCLMCAGAIEASRLRRLVYAANDSRKGAFGSIIDVLKIDGLFRDLSVDYGLMIDEASSLLKTFFRAKRSTGKDRKE